MEGRYSTALVSVLGWAFESCGSVVRTNLKFGHLSDLEDSLLLYALWIVYLHSEINCDGSQS